MIQAITETNLITYLPTEDNRINTSVTSTHIRHLFKFTNDMDASIHYVYPETEAIYDRYTYFKFIYDASDYSIYEGLIKFLPAGYWKYEAYEVSWEDTVTLEAGNAPANEDDVLTPPDADKGIVQGLITRGKMYVAEKDGTEQVQYIENSPASGTNYIWYGQ